MGKEPEVNQPTSYIITKAREGGYFVNQAWPQHVGSYQEMIFAATDISDALKFIKKKLDA